MSNGKPEQERVITLGDSAQAVFGPLHRHLAHIQEAFRDPNAPRGAPAYSVTLDAQGDRLIVRARTAADLERVLAILRRGAKATEQEMGEEIS